MKKVYFADFETTQPTEQDNFVEVYLWVILSGKSVFKGRSIEDFILWCKCKKNKCILYFHNLKFDFSYIQYYGLKHDIDFKILEKQGTIYSVRFWNIELRDSLNLLPMSLKEIGENYCVNFKKTSIDYNVFKGHFATKEEIQYCINDCRVLEEGLNNYLNTLEDVLTKGGAICSAEKVRKKLTNAGIAFEAFKELSCFNQCCPKTTQKEYELFRPAYHGGFVYSNPVGIVKDVDMIDCNSMYPFMYATIEMPFGKGRSLENPDEWKNYKFSILHILSKYELRKGKIAIIGGGFGRYGNTLYKTSSFGEWEEMTVCSTDLKIFEKFYHIKYKVIWAVVFDTKKGFFKKYADTFIDFKNKFKGTKRAVAKVLLNSPYGKTAMNGFSEIKKWFIDAKDESVKSSVIGYEVDDNSYQYLPMAIAITASARKYLLETANKIGFENVYYMDTDSIKFKHVENKIKCNPDILGMWKNEGHCEFFKTISPKKYCYWGVTEVTGKFDDAIHFVCAGFNKKVLESELYNNQSVSKEFALKLMNSFDKKLTIECLQSKVVKGGRALLRVKKEIK